MEIKDFLDQAKKHPAIAVTALLACIVIGGFGSSIYLKVSEQRTGLLGDRITLLEANDRNQKRVNQIMLEQLQALRTGYENLPASIKNVRKEFEYVASLKILEEAKRENINSVINGLAENLENVEIALVKSEAIVNTFDKFLNASAAEANGQYALAAKIYVDAAEIGNTDAQYRLGTLYARGKGVEQSLMNASYWYQQAASSGNTAARAELAQLYLSGEGVEMDKVMALALYKSVEKDVPLSVQEKIEELSKELSRDQVKLADEWAKKYSKLQLTKKSDNMLR